MVELGAAPFVLACLTFGLGICVAWITLRAEVPLLGVAAAAVAIRLCGPIETADAPFLLDGAFALLVAVTLPLPPLEYAAPAAVPREAVVRGFLWGGIGGVGILTKATFVMFGTCVAPLVLLVSFRRTGASATRHKMAAATAICVVPAAIFVRFGWSYLKAGWQAAYGDVAPLLNEGVAPSIFLRDTVNSAGYAYWLICGCLLVVALIRGRRDFHRLSLGLASIAIALVYLVMASLSQNQQPRYLWPIWLVLPLAAAAGIAPSQDRPAPSTRFFGVPIFALAVVWSLPMFSKLDFQNVREADALMHFLRTDHRIRFNALPKFGMVKSPTYTRR